MFLHGNMFHLFFNMFLIFLLGSMIERIHGSWFFLFLVLATQTAGMMVQVLLPDAAFMPAALRGSPLAIGASGAGYGLFGFMWIRPWLDPDYPIELDSTQFMLIVGRIDCLHDAVGSQRCKWCPSGWPGCRHVDCCDRVFDTPMSGPETYSDDLDLFVGFNRSM